ncbi:type IV conjugative transfer system protein TraV [Escherichia coli P0302308.11]|nr:type IV conjugative transfer system protein TraV [Escherichia coli P0302308.11]
MKQISLFIPLLGTLLLSGCAGTSTEFECNATTSDTCMTMEQANEKAKKLEQSSEAKPVAASLPRLAEGNFRTMPVQTVTATTPSGSRPAVTHPEQKLLAPRPCLRCPGSENGRSGQFSCTGNTSPSVKNG